MLVLLHDLIIYCFVHYWSKKCGIVTGGSVISIGRSCAGMVHGGVVKYTPASTNHSWGGARIARIRTLAALASAEAWFSGQHLLKKCKRNEKKLFSRSVSFLIIFTNLAKKDFLNFNWILSELALNAICFFHTYY